MKFNEVKDAFNAWTNEPKIEKTVFTLRNGEQVEMVGWLPIETKDTGLQLIIETSTEDTETLDFHGRFIWADAIVSILFK